MTRRIALVVVVAAVLAAACSGGDGDAGSSQSSSSTTSTRRTTTTSTSSTSTTQPPATDPEAVRPFLESLTDRYDAAVEGILADPRVAGDRSHAAVSAYTSLFSPASAFPETALQFWSDEGAQGHFYRPGPRGRMFDSTVMSVQVDSPDQVTFTVCTMKSIVIVDEAGSQVSSEGGVTSGSVVAVRLDGAWLVRDLTRTTSNDCPEPGAQP